MDKAAQQQIVYIRLVTGDEVIGDCLGEDEERTLVVIKSPMLMQEQLNSYTQSTAVVLSKYIPLGDVEVLPIERRHIMFMTPVVPEMKEFYNNSVVYTRQFVEDHISSELKRSNKALKTAILQEQERVEFGEELLTAGKNLVIPPNTSLH